MTGANQAHAVLDRAIESDDKEAARSILESVPDSATLLNAATEWHQRPFLTSANNVAMVELLLEFGAELGHVSAWWASGFGAHLVHGDVARDLMRRGATVTIHAAAAIGLEEEVERLLQEDPKNANAKGGDGATPLHFCRSMPTAQLLIASGAQLDAKDEDHESTPAQWLIRDAPDVSSLLLEEGASADIFLAAAMGDADLARRVIESSPDCASHRIGVDTGPFPGIGYKGRGGTIYQWTLGFNRAPHQVAIERDHHEVFDLLMEHSPNRTKFIVHALCAQRGPDAELLKQHPRLITELAVSDQELLAKYCWETNKSIEAVRLMLDLGWPTNVPETSHGFSALHNAAWCGDAELVPLLLGRGHPTDLRDPNHGSTAIGFALHSCLVEKRHPNGDFATVVQQLADAGVPLDKVELPTGNEDLDLVLERLARE